jgi:O-acetyl-ADP-ribose deacetylase (regulator of RNase III)
MGGKRQKSKSFKSVSASFKEGCKMKLIRQDILDVENGIICHQVNCRGVMGAGLAGAIARKWPHTKAAYIKAIKDGSLKFGGCLLSIAQEDIIVAHIAGQNHYGSIRAPTRIRFTDYAAVTEGIRDLLRQTNGSDTLSKMPVYFPYGMGCGLGGGTWDIVSKILKTEMPHAVICMK